MTQGSYRQFCPVADGGEILVHAWTVVLMRELLGRIARFNDLPPRCAAHVAALLSQRLKDLEVTASSAAHFRHRVRPIRISPDRGGPSA